MDDLENNSKALDDMNEWFGELAGPGSKTAMGVLLARVAESRRPQSERICDDPYAIHFVSQDMLNWGTQNPKKMKAMKEMHERLFPGLDNSLVARVRFFDDFVKKSIDEGLEQLAIVGAGYDTRAYRINELKNVMVFEVDHPITHIVKKQKINNIFGGLPDHVIYVPTDLEKADFGQKLLDFGYDRSKKTLFLIEGLLAYLPPSVVDGILAFIAKDSGKSCSILFDYHPKSVTDGNSELETGRNMWAHVTKMGEPFLFGIEDDRLEKFLLERGFSDIVNVTSEDYKRAYFKGVNEGRAVFSGLCFAHAVVKCDRV